MAASFVAGYAKVLESKEPRFLVLTGDEYALRQRIVDCVVSNCRVTNCSFDAVVGSDKRLLQMAYTMRARPSTETKTICITSPDDVPSWEWLPAWFNIVKGTRIVVNGASDKLAETLTRRANTRGYSIDCSSPRAANGQAKLAKLIAGWYGQSTAQVNHLLNKQSWQVTECIELLDKLSLLNLPLTSDTIMKLGVVHNVRDEFLDALTSDSAATAMSLIPSINTSEYESIVQQLSNWLDAVSRVKVAQAFMKSINELAFEVGEPRARTEKLVKESRRYELTRLNRLALTIAAADEQVTKGYRQGVLEILVSTW